jgi:hypothetical protein
MEFPLKTFTLTIEKVSSECNYFAGYTLVFYVFNCFFAPLMGRLLDLPPRLEKDKGSSLLRP